MTRLIQTLGNGRVQFIRGAESIELAGDTLVNIHDRDGEKFTTVQQHKGRVVVEAEKRSVQHFAVVTPYLAAVVKGTEFAVSVDGQAAQVEVERGQVHVADTDTGNSTEVRAGQSASIDGAGRFEVGGKGDLPAVQSATGQPVPPALVAVKDQAPSASAMPNEGTPQEANNDSNDNEPKRDHDRPGRDDGDTDGDDGGNGGDKDKPGKGDYKPGKGKDKPAKDKDDEDDDDEDRDDEDEDDDEGDDEEDDEDDDGDEEDEDDS